MAFSGGPGPSNLQLPQSSMASMTAAAMTQQPGMFQQFATLQQQHQQQLQNALSSGNQLSPQQAQSLQMMIMLRNQHLAALHQAAVANQQNQQSAGNNPFSQYQLTASTSRNPDNPAAKRQAVDANAQALALAQSQFRHLHAAGGLSHMSTSQQTQLYHALVARVRAQMGLAPIQTVQQAGAGRTNMRVSIDKRNRSAADKMFHGVDTTGRDHANEVVRRCEEVSRALRQHLAKRGKGKFNLEGSVEQVTQSQLIDACGDTARFLKEYQIVGINFLMLLYKTQMGGAILADEMGLGKTAQLITYLGAIKAIYNDPGPHLVVVPASLLENWQRELRRWCPAIKSVVYYGKHRIIVRKRLNDLRERLRSGETVDDDLADLQDADILAEAAASEKLAEAQLAANEDLHDADPFGAEIIHESDDEFDVKRADLPDNAQASLPPEPPPPKWDFNASLEPAPFDVMLTSYTLFERDSTDQRIDREFLESWRWSHLIMDEAHALKNRNAQRTTRLRRVANASRRRIMMTGTPLQNDLVELQNLMHFLLPQVFAAQGFENFADLIQGDENEVQRLTERMKELLGPFVLRRLKTEVAGQLTEKKHMTEFIEMTEEQGAMYEASLSSMRSQITGKVTNALTEEGQAAVERFFKMLGAKKINHMFTHLRKIAQHPLLIRHHYDDAKVEEIAKKAFDMELFSGQATLRRVTEELLSYSDYSLHAFCYNSGPEFDSYRLDTSHLFSSAKFRFLKDLLPKLKAAGSRPLVFSQWTAVLDVIEWLMDELRLPYVRLDGSTAVDERLATVDRFNTSDDVFAFLLSTRAGGQGLNLTGADTVILHDVDFNPQIDRQAEDRCHRLGQTKPVAVYRLITKASVDQNIYNLSQRKLKLDHAVLDGIVTGRGARQREAAQERQQMGVILHSLFAGKEEYEAMMENGMHERSNTGGPQEGAAEGVAKDDPSPEQGVEEVKEMVKEEVSTQANGIVTQGTPDGLVPPRSENPEEVDENVQKADARILDDAE